MLRRMAKDCFDDIPYLVIDHCMLLAGSKNLSQLYSSCGYDEDQLNFAKIRDPAGVAQKMQHKKRKRLECESSKEIECEDRKSPCKKAKAINPLYLSDSQVKDVIEALLPDSIQDFVVRLCYPVNTDLFISNCQSILRPRPNHLIISPLNIGSHWVVLFFRQWMNEFVYIDPLGNEMVVLKDALSRMFPQPKFSIKDLQQQVQFDGHSCGLWVGVLCAHFVKYCCQDFMIGLDSYTLTDLESPPRFRHYIEQSEQNEDREAIKSLNNKYINELRSFENLIRV